MCRTAGHSDHHEAITLNTDRATLTHAGSPIAIALNADRATVAHAGSPATARHPQWDHHFEYRLREAARRQEQGLEACLRFGEVQAGRLGNGGSSACDTRSVQALGGQRDEPGPECGPGCECRPSLACQPRHGAAAASSNASQQPQAVHVAVGLNVDGGRVKLALTLALVMDSSVGVDEVLRYNQRAPGALQRHRQSVGGASSNRSACRWWAARPCCRTSSGSTLQLAAARPLLSGMPRSARRKAARALVVPRTPTVLASRSEREPTGMCSARSSSRCGCWRA